MNGSGILVLLFLFPFSICFALDTVISLRVHYHWCVADRDGDGVVG